MLPISYTITNFIKTPEGKNLIDCRDFSNLVIDRNKESGRSEAGFKRNSGRTTEIVLNALELASKGESSTILVNGETNSKAAIKHVVSLLSHYSDQYGMSWDHPVEDNGTNRLMRFPIKSAVSAYIFVNYDSIKYPGIWRNGMMFHIQKAVTKNIFIDNSLSDFNYMFEPPGEKDNYLESIKTLTTFEIINYLYSDYKSSITHGNNDLLMYNKNHLMWQQLIKHFNIKE